MKKNILIHKIAHASLTFMICASHIASATDNWMKSWTLLEDYSPEAIVESGKEEAKQAPSELLRNNDYYRQELQKLEESTARIHAEVDRILVEFRKNMEKYYLRTRDIRAIIEIEIEAEEPKEEDALGLKEYGFDFIPLSLGRSPLKNRLIGIRGGQWPLFQKDSQLYCKASGCNEMMIPSDEDFLKVTTKGLAPDIHDRLTQYASDDYVEAELLQSALINLGHAPIVGQHCQEACGGATPESLEASRKFIIFDGYTIQKSSQTTLLTGDLTSLSVTNPLPLNQKKEGETNDKKAAVEKDELETKEREEGDRRKKAATEFLEKVGKSQIEDAMKAALHLLKINIVNEKTNMDLVELLEAVMIFQAHQINDTPPLDHINFLNQARKEQIVLKEKANEDMLIAVAKYIKDNHRLPGGVVRFEKTSNFIYSNTISPKHYLFKKDPNINNPQEQGQEIGKFFEHYQGKKEAGAIIVFNLMVDIGRFMSSILVGGDHQY